MEVTCPGCQKAFTMPMHRYKEGRRFCSRVCYDADRKEQMRLRRERPCKQCGKPFVPMLQSPGIYCSKKCRAAFQKGEHHNRYEGGKVTLTCEQCGKDFAVFPTRTRRKNPAKLCSHACAVQYQRGPNAPSWSGGRRVDSQGYVLLYMPDHQHAFANGYVHEHVLVAEATIGRRLTPGEEVHHDNEIRDDNRPENLIVLTTSEHQKLHRAREKQKRLIQSNSAAK